VERSSSARYVLLLPDGYVCELASYIQGIKSIVFFKGSFDPIHNGHIALFKAAISKYGNTFGAFSMSFDTAKRSVPFSDMVYRARLIHETGYGVIVSSSGYFSDNVAFIQALDYDIKIIFPLGVDVLLRLLDYYTQEEFEGYFQRSVFEYYHRHGCDINLPAKYRGVPNLNYLGENEFSPVSSSQLKKFRAEGAEDAVRALMPPCAADIFLSTKLGRVT
jgi:nicotinic acid mononucleotide adenylyltransferase